MVATPSSPPDFRLYQSNSLEVLAGLLAEALRHPASGQALLVPDTILIPQAAMRRWLQACLAQAHGIAANLEFLTPGEFVRRALDANVPGAGEELDAEALRWRLYAVLVDPDALRDPALATLRGYLADGDPLKPWSLAGELAASFEKYQAWRRDWLLGWERGEDPRDAQAALWRKVAKGRAHRARRIDEYLRAHGGPGDGHEAGLPSALPSRLFAFATLNVSPDVLRVIATQARVGTLHFYLPTPAKQNWGDLRTRAEQLRADDAEAFAAPDNPLLEAWGAAGRDFMAVLGAHEVVHPTGEVDAFDDPEERAGDTPADDTLLQRLQRDLLHRRAPVAWRGVVDRKDRSLQVHACHTRLREVQVLHDQLRGLLEDDRFDPPLQPREIAVLAPDIDPYVPHIEAVFGGRAGRPDFIPHALADASTLAGDPLAEAFLRLLGLPLSRFGLGETLDLLACAPIAEAAGLDAPALERLHDWLHAAGARWGLDASHRARHGAPADEAFTWRFALDRLLLGHASGDEALMSLEDGRVLAPWPELEGGHVEALGSLVRLVQVLERHARLLAEPASPAQWRERLFALLDVLLPDTPEDPAAARTLARLRELLGAFAESAAQAGVDARVPPEVVRSHFASLLAESDTRAPLLTGGVSFGRMVPMRLLPFRVICVLGLNDGDYPRRDPATGLNRLAADLGTSRRRPGDRSLREDDRFLFLQLFAAAAEVFYASYLGADARDGSVREPSVLVAELLDAAAALHADPVVARKALVVRQPLQPFAPGAFGGADEPRRFSYQGEWHPAAGRREGPRTMLSRWVDTPLPAVSGTDVLTIAELQRFLLDPVGSFLQHRLGMRLPDAPEWADDVEPLLVPGGGLDRHRVQQAALEAAKAGETGMLEATLRAQGSLASGPLAAAQLAGMVDDAQVYAGLFERWRAGRAESTLAIDFELDGVRIQGRLPGVFDGALARIRVGEPSGPSMIRDGLHWVLANAADASCTLAQFHDAGAGPAVHERAALSTGQARAALSGLLRLRARGLAEPLPWGPYTGWAFHDAPNPDRARDAAWKRWRGDPAQGRWGEGQAFAFRLALRGRDPFDDGDLFASFVETNESILKPVLQGEPA
ncbi:MAG TPA: exodeoxyribonuclease V subunit gamma [Xanthomonadaceae bacterium]|nr:exodeoxyribonuclease V subunit gamma [Xanthomonadaceae bacterium]